MLVKIKKNEDFRKVYNGGTHFIGKAVILYVKKSDSPITRVGITYSKKIKKASRRNFLRRRVTEILRKVKFKKGFELVFVIRKKAEELNFFDLGTEILGFLQRQNILIEDV